MYTQCPACSTYFRITPEQLQAAGGKVRCGECRNVFHAPDFLTDTLPAAPTTGDEPLYDEPDYEELLREPQTAALEAPEDQAMPPTEEAVQEPLPEDDASVLPAQGAANALSIDLDKLFGNDTDTSTAEATLTEAPVEETVTPPPPPGDAYGEDDIEALLTHVPDDDVEDSAPQPFALPWDEAPAEAAPPAVEPAPDIAAHAPADVELPESAVTTAHSIVAPPALALSPLSAMLEEEDTAPRSLLAGLAWTLGILLLVAVLALQYIYLNRVTLVHQAELRPLLELLCEHTGCRLPPRRDLTALTLLERDIRSHERYQGALTIVATLQNRAAFAQPYPAVEVVMRDLGGKVVAVRRFLPQEYLAGNTAALLLAPQGTAQLVLDVVDPGAEAVGFEFTFH
jgi:predicted Zn finger-like uncharacterized protein